MKLIHKVYALLVYVSIITLIKAGPINLYEYTFEGSVEDIVWLKQDRSTILFLTDEKEVHRSLDDGKTFTSLKSHLNSLISPVVELDSGIKGIFITEYQPNFVFLQSSGTVHYISEDGGYNFKAIRSPSPIDEIKIHPLMPTNMLWSSLSTNCLSNTKYSNDNKLDDGLDSSGKKSCYKALYMSEDGGTNSKLLKKYIVQFDWADNLIKKDLDSKKVEIGNGMKTRVSSRMKNPLKGSHKAGKILVTVKHPDTGTQKDSGWDPNIDLYISDPNTWNGNVLVKGGNKFLFLQNYLFVAVAGKDRKVSLAVSQDKTSSFYSGKLPFDLETASYTVLDSSSGIVFLHVDHREDRSGIVYVSDSTGFNYTFSLRDNVRGRNGKCDFDRIMSIEGVYIANYYEKKDLSKNSHIRKGKRKMKTLITFDRGGEWSTLAAPEIDSLGNAIDCSDEDCSLNLHGHSGDFAPVYSSENALGLIIGVGNVGTELSFKADEANTFFSRDGGLTWSEIRKGAYIYELGDHGGIVAMTKDTEPTTKLLYSWKQGSDWTEIDFTKSKMDVDNIIIEPKATSRIFHVYGTRSVSGGKSKGVMITTDFTKLGERECQGATIPKNPDSDYEIWSPRDTPASPGGFGNGCHMGHIIEYTRRKKDSNCFNPNQFEAERFMKVCECTQADYECDVGYYRKHKHGKCIRDFSVNNFTARVVKPKHCPLSGLYEISNGYRLTGGNTCVGGIQIGPTVYECSNGFLGISSGGWFVILVVILLALSMICMTKNKINQDDNIYNSAFGTQTFGEGDRLCWDSFKGILTSSEKRKEFFSNFHGQNDTQFSNAAPDSMAFDDGDFGDEDYSEDQGEEFDFNDEDIDKEQEAELISTTDNNTSVKNTNSKVAVPKINHPPNAQPIKLLDDDDDDDLGDIV